MKRLIISLVFFIMLVPPLDVAAYGWGYQKSTDGSPPDPGLYRELVEKHGGHYVDHSGEKVIYLTFDNGYEQGYTGQILDVLKKEQVPATFFVTGHYITSASELVKRMVNEGHIVGNHSYHHPDFTESSDQKIKEELQAVEDAVAELTSQKEMQYVRPPRGTFNSRTLAITNKLGYTTMFWSIAFVDWHTDKQKGPEYAVNSVLKQIHPGAIILLHTVSRDNALALEQMIQQLKQDGYTFKSLDYLVVKEALPRDVLPYTGIQ
ncbi:polysaccharide deacetylase [Pontibacillus halophilus JSM 076056 = DSM 19796]|uniref:Polysaccharide deacetylase n=1 Tax=Pontibacillus halophilus JSM 076056 = DSM 19796 TaxID=1385510 RepID=A0A0A5GP87_9BACI|nr:delta-lactam-biosynthetic de-N-acetylase [Pontibacillus halophilus]KGX92975.1 polysaccharide deacetylase [Pontibacillus halophilus JSM 076056 = DSM 19796]